MTITDEQIEKASKAANAAACTSNPDVDVEELWERLDPYEQDEWRRAVRAALEAVMPGESGELERLREVAREAFLAFEAHWSSAGGSPEEHAKFMQHRRRFYEFYEPFRAALAEGGGE